MPDAYRWTLDEYVLRCEDGAGLAEILTEGGLDRDVIADAVRRWDLAHVTVIDADYIAVTPEELASLGFSIGVKAQLVSVALKLEERALEGAVQARIAIVVDRDYDPPSPPSRYLYETDGHSMESYVLNEEALDRFASVGLGRFPRPRGRGGVPTAIVHTSSGSELLARLLPAATEIAAVRLALRDLDPPLAPFERWMRYLVSDDQGVMGLDGATLLQRILVQDARGDDVASAEERRRAAVAEVEASPISLVRGRDLITVFQRCLQSSWGTRVGGSSFRNWSEDRFARVLFLALPADVLDGTPLFRALRIAMTA
jgi:hypothetical protein